MLKFPTVCLNLGDQEGGKKSKKNKSEVENQNRFYILVIFFSSVETQHSENKLFKFP